MYATVLIFCKQEIFVEFKNSALTFILSEAQHKSSIYRNRRLEMEGNKQEDDEVSKTAQHSTTFYAVRLQNKP